MKIKAKLLREQRIDEIDLGKEPSGGDFRKPLDQIHSLLLAARKHSGSKIEAQDMAKAYETLISLADIIGKYYVVGMDKYKFTHPIIGRGDLPMYDL